MLVITRRSNEEVVIGGNVRLRVLGIRGHRVQLGIEAPLDVSIRRDDACEPAAWRGSEEPLPLPPR